jgi:ATP-binding cassette subfamily C protein CydCD
LPTLTRRLLTLARDSRLALAAVLIFGLLTGVLIITQADGLSRIVEQVFLGGQSLAGVMPLVRVLISIIFLRALLGWGSEVCARVVAANVKSDLRQRLFDKILSLGPAYTRAERSGELVNTAMEGVEALDAYFSQYLPQLALAALIPFSILVAIFPRDALSGAILLMTAPLIPVFMYLIGKTAEKLTRRQWETLSRLSAHFLDSLQGLTTLKELGRSRDRAGSIKETSDRFRDVTLGVLRVTFLSALVLEMVGTVSTAVVAVEIGLRLLYGQMAFQQAFFILLLAPEFYLPLRKLGLGFHSGMSGTTAARRIFEILDLPTTLRPGNDLQGSAEVSAAGQKISFQHVSYTYPGEIETALQDICLEIEPGQHIALVGASGAGKSTMAALLLGFMEPSRGNLAINGQPITNIPLEIWRARVAWVPQNPYLFHDTVGANLRLAKPDASDRQLEVSCRAARLDELIQSLPDGFGTIVGEEGTRLSAGQAQRLAMARAFLKDAPILILDESTSSLDPQEESQIETAMHELMHGRTVITIAQRLNTVLQADKIFVLEKGFLVEAGTHQELLALGGIYSRMVSASIKLVQHPSKPMEHRYREDRGTPEPFHPDAERQPSQHHPPTVTRLLGHLHGSWDWLALSVLLGTLTIVSNIGLMGTSAFLISAAALHPAIGTLQVAIVGVRFFGIVRGVFRYAERLTSHQVTFRLLANLRSWFYRVLEPLAPARLMAHRSGDLLARIISDVESLEDFYVRAVAPPLTAIVIAIVMLIFLGRYDPHLAWIYLAYLLVLGAGAPVLAWVISRRFGAELTSRRAALYASLLEGILGLPELLVFNRGRDYARSLNEAGKAYRQNQQQHASLTGFSLAVNILVMNLGMLTMLAAAIPMVVSGALPGVMLAVVTLAAMAGFEAVLPLPLAAQTLSSSLQSARRLYEIADDPPMVRDSISIRETLPLDSNQGHTLQVSSLTFSYPDQTQHALQDIDLLLTPGESIAVIGPSGAGKSTLANLLLRFWDFSDGRIMIDGLDLHEYTQEDVRRMFSISSQRTYFFNDTIRQNLLLARPSASDLEMEAAARKAHIHEFILGLSKGYDTVIGERGFRLSAGERQRLAIARALLKQAPILLLDEPTANLDPLMERKILENLFELRQGQSLLLMTHRYVGLENMDEILVLDHGCLVERGRQADLLATDGLFRRLWDLQNRIIQIGTGA